MSTWCLMKEQRARNNNVNEDGREKGKQKRTEPHLLTAMQPLRNELMICMSGGAVVGLMYSMSFSVYCVPLLVCSFTFLL